MQDSPQDQKQVGQQGQQSPSAVQQPVSIPGSKEHAPGAPIADIQIQEVSKPPELSPELEKAGVEHGPDAKEHELAEEVKKVGVRQVKEATPFVPSSASSQPVNLPMKYDEVLVAEKQHTSAKNSFSWFVRLVGKEWKKILLGKGESK